MELGKLLTFFYWRSNLKMGQFAATLGVSKTYLNMILNGEKSNITMDKIEQISESLSLTPQLFVELLSPEVTTDEEVMELIRDQTMLIPIYSGLSFNEGRFEPTSVIGPMRIPASLLSSGIYFGIKDKPNNIDVYMQTNEVTDSGKYFAYVHGEDKAEVLEIDGDSGMAHRPGRKTKMNPLRYSVIGRQILQIGPPEPDCSQSEEEEALNADPKTRLN